MSKARRKKLVHEYFVKWAGYATEHNSWEPAAHLITNLAETLAASKRSAIDAARTWMEG